MKLSDTSNQILERIKQNGWQGKIVSVEHVPYFPRIKNVIFSNLILLRSRAPVFILVNI
jgi:hypothetical protein